MDIDYLHVFVDQVAPWQQWFIQHMQAISPVEGSSVPQPIPLKIGQVVILLSDPSQDPAAAAYLERHPAGVGDVAFQVRNLDQILQRFLAQGGQLSSPVQEQQWEQGRLRWAQIQGWGCLRHTLIERRGATRRLPGNLPLLKDGKGEIVGIDHAVLNVPAGHLAAAATWYERTLGFCSQQQFVIKTPYSGLYSRVLKHPDGNAQLPVNEPATVNSQIQEFLDWHRGAGIQHAALLTSDILKTVPRLRQRGLAFLKVPEIYYQQIPRRPGFRAEGIDLAALKEQQVLVDWTLNRPQLRLLQTFTQTIFDMPTLFFELIERQQTELDGDWVRAEGFGEGNFQALFEAIEREQSQRGSLQVPSGENY